MIFHAKSLSARFFSFYRISPPWYSTLSDAGSLRLRGAVVLHRSSFSRIHIKRSTEQLHRPEGFQLWVTLFPALARDDPRRGLVKKHLAWPRFIALDPAQFNKVQKETEDSRSRWRIIAHSIVFSALASIALSCRCGTGYVFSMFCKLWWRYYDSKAWIRIVMLCLIWTIFGHTLFTLGCPKYDILAWSI